MHCRILCGEYFQPLLGLLLLSVAVLFGVSDEWHQSFVLGRHSTISDLIVDTIGSALGVGIVYLRAKRKETQERV